MATTGKDKMVENTELDRLIAAQQKRMDLKAEAEDAEKAEEAEKLRREYLKRTGRTEMKS